MNWTLCAVGFAALCATWTAPAAAGIADSPLPVLSAGATTFHLYSVPGVISSGGLRTYFSCTSTDTATMHVGVELFDALGGAPANDDAATSLSVIAGATVIFGTGPRLGFRGCRRHNRGKLTEPANIGRWPHPPRGAACARCGRLRSVAARPIGIIEWLSSEARASSGSRSSPPRASQTDSVSSLREWRCRAGSAARCA